MVNDPAQGDELTVAAPVAAGTRLRRVAGFNADSLTLSLVPSASEPAFATVRLSPETVVTGRGGQPVAPAVLSRALLVALTVESQADGSVLATTIAVRSIGRKARQTPAATA